LLYCLIKLGLWSLVRCQYDEVEYCCSILLNLAWSLVLGPLYNIKG
jgi:hypothetical protein